MPYKKTEEQKRFQSAHYQKYKQKFAERVRARKRVVAEWVRSIKRERGCKRCGERDPVCLDFHHRDPAEKTSSISNLQRLSANKEKVLAEIEKCDVLCANCHRKQHAEENNLVAVAA